MKNLVLSIILVVLLAAAVVGGQALASSKPADVTVSEETSAILGSSYWGYPLRIKSLSGTAEISADEQILLDETYPGTRHVSLTVFNWGSDSGIPPFADGVQVSMYIPFLGYNAIMESHQTNYYRTFEFDTDNWKLRARDYGNQTLKVYYWATITYPSNQW